MRIRIVDVQHMFYKFAFGGASALSATLVVDGVPQIVDTTLPAYTIKALHRYADFGFNPLVVCFEGRHSLAARKSYFSDGGEGIGYKEDRSVQDRRFYDGINMTHSLLHSAGVVTLRADGYEADDLIMAAVRKAKAEYPGVPIDIITGDHDLLPLVDEQVSVYMVSKKMMWAESKEQEIRGYFQVTPRSWSKFIECVTRYAKLYVPYNTVLLTKLLRGDKSDNIPGYPKFTPTKYNNLVLSLESDGHDMGTLFRYWENAKDGVDFLEPPELGYLCEVLSKYLDEDMVGHVRHVYNGINLNGAFPGRRPARVTVDIKGYDEASLQQQVSKLLIKLPMG